MRKCVALVWGGVPCLGLALFLCFWGPSFPGQARAQERAYVVGYCPGAAIHTLVRDRLMAVYGRAGLAVRFLALPHKRSLFYADSGVVDAEAARVAGFEDKYPNLRRVEEKIADLVGVAYVRRDSGITAYSDALLDTRRVGHVLGVLWAQEKMAGRPATTVVDYRTLFGILLHGRVDMVMGSRVSAQAVLEDMGERADEFMILEPVVYSAPMYHFVHKKNAALIPLLERAIRELRREHYWQEQDKAAASISLARQ